MNGAQHQAAQAIGPSSSGRELSPQSSGAKNTDTRRCVRASARSTSLQAQAETRANEDYSRRLAEIKAMAPLLARLDAFIPALKQRGLEVFASGLRLYTEHREGRQQKLLRIDTAGILDSRRPAHWLEALLALGFIEVRRSGGAVPQVVLRNSHLWVQVDCPETLDERAAIASTYAQRMAAEAAAEHNARLAA